MNSQEVVRRSRRQKSTDEKLHHNSIKMVNSEQSHEPARKSIVDEMQNALSIKDERVSKIDINQQDEDIFVQSSSN